MNFIDDDASMTGMSYPSAAPFPWLIAPWLFGHDGLARSADGTIGYRDLPDNIVRMLWGAVSQHEKRWAVAEVHGRRLTYDQLWRAAGRVAGGLRDAGVRRGDRVALRLVNSADWVLAFFGTLLSGAIVVPIDTRLTDAEAGRIVEDSDAAYVFRAGAALPDGAPLVIDDQEARDTAAILYTSGTTGSPKGGC